MTPDFKIYANGKDVTAYINKNASKIDFLDDSGRESDQINLTIEGSFKKPNYKDELKLFIGSKEKGLFCCGLFTVQTADYKRGSSNCMEISATAVDFSKNMKVKRSRSFENISIKKLVEIIASRHNLNPACDYDDVFIIHEEQSNESDLHFLKRLASENNAIFSIKNNKVVFKKKMIDGKKSSNLPRYNLEVDEQTDLNIQNSDKKFYRSCKIIWRDTKDNEQKSVVAGSGQPQKVLKGTFDNEQEAKQKAQAKLDKLNSGTKVGDISCAGFIIYAGGILNLTGTIDDDSEYEIKTVNHTLDENGWNIQIDIEN